MTNHVASKIVLNKMSFTGGSIHNQVIETQSFNLYSFFTS